MLRANTETGREMENMREAARHRERPDAASGEGVVARVDREDDEYVAFSQTDKPLGRARALNVSGDPVALNDGGQLFFGAGLKDFKVEPMAHKGGLLRIE